MVTFEDRTENIIRELKKNKGAIRERVKELTCMYALLRLGLSSHSIDQFLKQAVQVIPEAWQYPLKTGAKIDYHGNIYASPDFQQSKWMQKSAVNTHGHTVGTVCICYSEQNAQLRKSPFLKEEQDLIDAVASILSLVAERMEDTIKIKRSEKRYRQFIKNFKGIHFQADFSYHPQFLYGDLEGITGYSRHEFMGKNMKWTDIVHPEDVGKLMGDVDQLKAEPSDPIAQDYRIVSKAGKTLWVKEILQCIVGASGRPQKIIGTIFDITKEIEGEERIERLNSVLLAIRNINQLIVSEKDLQRLVQGSCSLLMDARSYKTVWILLFEAGFKLKMGCCQGIGPKFDDFLDQVSKGRIPYCIREVSAKKSVVFVEHDEVQCKGCMLDIEKDYKQVFVPLRRDATFYGVLSISYIKDLKMESHELDLLKEVAGDISFALYNLKLEQEREQIMHKLQSSYKETKAVLAGTIRTLSSVLETKDPYTHTHQIKVSRLAKKIALALELAPQEVEGIETAALMHDIGKISIPSDILSKPGKLSDIEFQMIMTHPKISYNMLQKIHFKQPVAEYVLQHHERLDGSGYPVHLKGPHILMGAKILAVADVVEAISAHRPYRPAKGISAAIGEIGKNKGKLYEPRVVDACLDILQKNQWS